MNRNVIDILFTCFIATIAIGCTQDETTPISDNKPNQVIITGSIESATTVESRAGKDKFNTWKKGGFDENDAIGFYSEWGATGNPSEGFKNECLTYTTTDEIDGATGDDKYFQTFYNPNLGNTPSNWGRLFAYFPYAEQDTENKNIIQIFDNTDNNEWGQNKLIDLLTATSSGLGNDGLIHFSFQHAFSMLFIFPGTGFSIQEKDEIKVYLKKGVAYAQVSKASGQNFRLELIQTDKAKKDYIAIPNDQAITPDDEIRDDSFEENSFFYVLVPSETEVDYIEIKDIFGETQKVRPNGILPKLERGMRYTFTVQMQGDQPTLWPGIFTPWDQQEEIVEERRGISEVAGLKTWISEYNSNPASTNEKLTPYGTYNDEEDQWEFYLNNDIDCSKLDIGTSRLLTQFKDVLDGNNHSLRNLTLNGENPCFIETLKGGGQVKNLKLENVTITASAKNTPIGAIVNTMEGGTINNCKITELRMESQGPVGAIAGSVSNGIIQNNTSGGILICNESATTYSYFIGKLQDSPAAEITFTGNFVTNLIFQSTN